MRKTPANVSLQDALARLAKGGPEQQAIEAGEIDAIVDRASSNVILFPAARRALREIANRAPAANPVAAVQASIANSLLAALPDAEYQHLLAGLEPVALKSGDVLHEPGVPIRHVYFPIDCIVSLLMRVEGRHALAVGLVGHEGMVGIPVALGMDVSLRRALVQESGTAMRMESGFFHKAVLQSKTLREALYQFEHALVGQISQSAACNAVHSIRVRLARYLLLTLERASSTQIHLKHDFLARVLGTRRVGITEAAGALRKRGLIKYDRGEITILDRKRLAAAACGCYEIIKRIYDSAYAGR